MGAPQRLSAFVVHSSLFLGLSAAAEAYAACALLGVQPNAALPVAFLATVGVYNLDKASDVAADAVTYPERAAFVGAHLRPYAALSGVAYVVGVALAIWRGGLPGAALTLFPAAVGVAYSLPVIPGPGPTRLKDVFVVNTFVVALAWALPVALLPAAVASGRPLRSPAVGVAAAWYFLRSVGSVEVHNVRDVAGDRAAGVVTLPTVIGATATRYVLYGVDALSGVLAVAAVVMGIVPAFVAVGLAPALCVSAWLTRSLAVPARPTEHLCTLRDAEGLVMAAGVVPAYLMLFTL
ncbi:UbiA family prenyltransferase [Halarchaeum sp. P4]|uniref:UbiA family prenyltransferase n=1 Tax=Halarchaeum sp. P4 TaxID=3421639 RepID=UPI003EB94367